MKKQITLSIIGLFIISLTYSQTSESTIQFNKKTHNFGTIEEANGIQTYQFKFTNTGKKPLIINNVKASCGCTTPEWTKAPIASKKDGFIKVSFDPINRPGPFNKSITITSNATNSPTKLIIKGIVKERAKTIDDKYKSDMNGLKFKTNHIAITKIFNNQKKSEEISIYNPTNKKISVLFDRLPAHIQLDKTKFTINPKEKMNLKLTYDASKKNDWGYITDKILVFINNDRNPKNRILVSANIEENFSNLSTEQLANAPKITIDNKIFNFGDIKQGESKSHKFIVKNSGKSDLIVRKIKSSCGCTVVKLNKKIIKPGQSEEISVIFKSKGKEGKQHKMITIISNDPTQQSLILRVKGNVN